MAVGMVRELSSTFEWDISNYSSYSDLETGKFINSPSFNLLNSRWYLELYPNGDLFLKLKKESQISARFAISLIDSKNEVILSHDLKKKCQFSSGKFWGADFDNDASIKALNKITILCELVIEEEILYKTILMISPDRLQHFQEFRNLLNNPKFTDVKFTVDNREIHAHKMVLAANSTVFAAMFEHEMRENIDNLVKIEGISYKVFNALLDFIYSGECTLSEDIVSELFKAADKYQLLKLKDMCEKELCKNISVNNVVASLQLADMHSAERLKKEAINFTALHGREIIDRPEFDSLKSLHPDLFKDVLRDVFARIN